MTGPLADNRHQCHTHPEDMDTARQWIRDTLSHLGVAVELQRDLTLAFTEITSSVLPRVEGRAPEDKVEIQLSVTNEAVQMCVVDSSPPFERGAPSDFDGEGGMGLILLNVLADDVKVAAGPAGGSVTTIMKQRNQG